jgi:2,5-dihydroxypyridine 5,6-dioxygenase
MPVSDAELISAWTRVLRLSNLQEGQVVTVLTSQATHPQTMRTAIAAAGMLGARVNRLDLPPVNADKALSRDSLAYLGTTPLTGNPAAIAALKASDLVLDLMTLLFSPEQAEILESGTKILLAVEPPEVLVRMVPTEADRDMVNEAAAMLEKASEMHVTSAAGTDVRFRLGDLHVVREYGFVDLPGRWDHWPSGFSAVYPNEGSAEGRVVFDVGDILLPQKYYLSTPIELTIEKGYVRDIRGGIDAELLIDYIESFNDPEATLGMDARAFAGNFLFSLGPNNEGGGTRVTACHLDVPMRKCTVRLDGRTVVENGKVVSGRAPAAEAAE